MVTLDDFPDWHPAPMPSNIVTGDGALIETTYSLGGFGSELECGLRLGDHSAIWNPAMLYVGPAGRIEIGDVTCINGSIIEANECVQIGSYVNVAWGAVISDSLLAIPVTLSQRRETVLRSSHSEQRLIIDAGVVAPVTIEDDAWIGFEAIIGPGVTVGQGAIVGAKSWVDRDIEPFAIVAGVPARVIGTARR